MIIKEIQKIMLLKEGANEEEKRKLDSIEEIFAVTFKAMVDSAETFILNGEVKKATLSDAKEAFDWLKAYAETKEIEGVEFPEVTTAQDLAVYLLNYGKEIIFK